MHFWSFYLKKKWSFDPPYFKNQHFGPPISNFLAFDPLNHFKANFDDVAL